MNKFCTNCGAELKENADFCVKCGVAVNKVNQNIVKPKQEGKGCGIASLILGIASVMYGVFCLFIFLCLLMAGEYFIFEEKVLLAFIFLFMPIVLSVIGLPLGISSRNKNKNGINLTGIILNLVTIGICALSIMVLALV